jgi:hypothetical protein
MMKGVKGAKGVKGVKGAKVRMTPQVSPREYENHVLIPNSRGSGGIGGPSWPFVDAHIFGSGAGGGGFTNLPGLCVRCVSPW